MTIRALLDEAAAEATVGLRIDLVEAHRRASARRRVVRRREVVVAASAVAVAAVIALIAVLLPVGGGRAAPPVPADPAEHRLGLPEHWYHAPAWVPPVTRHPMAAASMVLVTPQRPGWGRASMPGPVLVSADGRQYAGLPGWTTWDRDVALSADGRNVAWVTRRDDRGGPDPAVVHRIRLRDGRRSDVPLPKRVVSLRLLWQGDRLLMSVASPGKHWWMLGLADGSDVLRSGGRPPQALDGATTNNFQSPGDFLATTTDTSHPPAGRNVDFTYSNSPPNRRTGLAPVELEIGGSGGTYARRPIPPIDGRAVSEAAVLGWNEGGFVVRYDSWDGAEMAGVRLESYRWDGTTTGQISGVDPRGTYPVAVAWDFAGGPLVRARPSAIAVTDRDHLRFLAVEGWTVFGVWFWPGVLLALAVVASTVLVRRRLGSRPLSSGSDRESGP
jgi:hypothetical protein